MSPEENGPRKENAATMPARRPDAGALLGRRTAATTAGPRRPFLL